MQETQFGGAGADGTRERRVIHFTSGETLDLDSEEEEEEERPAFRDTERKARLKNLAMRVGRLSLLVCDFLGERLAGALGLNDAKYQYAIDQHQRGKKPISSDEWTTPLSPEAGRSLYGATEETCPGEGQIHSEDQRRDTGRLNRAYQAEDSHLE